MLFGNPESLAVEAEFGELHGKWTYGRLRFWADGSAFGDFEDTTDLATSARWGRVFLKASKQRTRPDLDALDAHSVFELLYGRFVQPIGTPLSKPWHGSWDRDPYVLDDFGESSLRDKFALVVVRHSDGSDRILVYDFRHERLSEMRLPDGECDRTVESFCEWAENLRGTPARSR